MFDHLQDIFSEIERREPYLPGATPIYYAGLYHSQKARALNEILNQNELPKHSLMPESNPNLAPSKLLILPGKQSGLSILKGHWHDARRAVLDWLAAYVPVRRVK